MVSFCPPAHPSLPVVQVASSPLTLYIYGAAKPDYNMILHVYSSFSNGTSCGTFPEVLEKWHGLVKTLLSNRLCVSMVSAKSCGCKCSEHVQGKVGRATWQIIPV